MPCITQMLQDKNLIKPPKWLTNNIQYEVISGSRSYGTNREDSDYDIVGFVMPPKDVVFPHSVPGYIHDFGPRPKEQKPYKSGQIEDKNAGKSYDATIYSIVRYFQLAMENNANMVDTLFVSDELITKSTTISEMVREKRKLFLHKGCWHKFKGYAYDQARKAGSKTREGNRLDLVEKFGYDVKAASNCVRLVNEVEMILEEGDLDLRRNNEHVKAIRSGVISEEEFRNWFAAKELALEQVYTNSKIPHSPDEKQIRKLLINCLEHHYGSLEKLYTVEQEKPRLVLRSLRENFVDGSVDHDLFTDRIAAIKGLKQVLNVVENEEGLTVYFLREENKTNAT
jgi:predicted nucleotidyltransferase